MSIRKAVASRGGVALFRPVVLACLGAGGSPEAGGTEPRRNEPKAADGTTYVNSAYLRARANHFASLSVLA